MWRARGEGCVVERDVITLCVTGGGEGARVGAGGGGGRGGT